MPNVTYDDRSWMIDGRRIWLSSGSLHYFRVPAALWADRLLKAKRAGLNCISTYVAWNFHEPAEGDWRLDGDADVFEFVRLAGEMGLYVILRPGPYICSEWDFGGLPGWLVTKRGMSVRTSNAAFTHYFDKYFRTVLPRLAELQVPRGGPIILVQNENEYANTTMPDRLNYVEFINQLFRRSGFEIPIINCNKFTDPPVPESIECVNTSGRAVELLKRLRLRRPEAPLLVTELWSGWFDFWGEEHHGGGTGAQPARRAMEVLGCGGQFNYYMWHGGTNFAFWGGRGPVRPDTWLTTSYDYDAPLAEGGGLTPKYYYTRLVNMLATHMGEHLATCAMEEPGVTIHDASDVLNTYGHAGRWAVVTNAGREDIEEVTISLPEGPRLSVPLVPVGAAALPIDMDLNEEVHLDYCNLTPLGLFGERVLVLHGPAGWEATWKINGEAFCDTVPKGDEPAIHEHEKLRLVLVNTELAMRTWFVEETLVFGPAFVGETIEQIEWAPKSKQIALLPLDGKLTCRKPKAPDGKGKKSSKPRPPRLGQWKRVRVCAEPVNDELEWTPLSGPQDLDSLGVHYGYAWYQVELQADRARKRNLMLPDCEDRAQVYLNGELLGTWGRGDGATRDPMPASLKKGVNKLTLLVDNLGRRYAGPRLGEERKGLYGHVYDAKPLRTRKPKIKTEESLNRRLVPRHQAYLLNDVQGGPVHTAAIDVTLSKVTPVHLRFGNVSCHVAVMCNGRLAGFFARHDGVCWGELTLGSELKKGRNTISLVCWGELDAKELAANVELHALENLSDEAKWSWRAWGVPEGEGPLVGKDQPAWYATKFKYPGGPAPLFLNILSAKKGQIFLNGHNVGRFWTLGPQHRYYLPECWLAEENELLIFEEHGGIPSSSRLEHCPNGPHAE